MVSIRGQRAKGGGLSPRVIRFSRVTRSATLPEFATLSGVRPDASPALTPVVISPKALQNQAPDTVKSGWYQSGDSAPKGGGLSPRDMRFSLHYSEIETAIPARFAIPIKSGNDVLTFSQSSIIMSDSALSDAIVNAIAIR